MSGPDGCRTPRILLGLAAALAAPALPAAATPRRAEAARVAPARLSPANGLHYRLGGVMSGPIDLILNLDSGRFVIEEARPPRTGAVMRQAGTLAAGVTRGVRRRATAALEQGLESEACRRSRVPQPPVADAIRMMTITLHGRQATAPDSIACWSGAADAAAGAAYSAVHAAAPGRADAARR